jgi:RecB family exonuclease
MKKVKATPHPTYRLSNGDIVPGTTSIIGGNLGWNKSVLMGWARKMALSGKDPDAIKSEAANIGSIAHFMVECYINKTEPDLSEYEQEHIDLAQNALDAYITWENEHNIVPIQAEMVIVSERYRYGGTIDMIGDSEGDIVLVDFKTSKSVYADHIIQVSAYKNLYEEALKSTIKNCYILRLDKNNGSFSYYQLQDEEVRAGWSVFLHCLELNSYKDALDIRRSSH